jgi:dephospho-CoA kinase
MRALIVAGMPGAGKEELLKVASGMGIGFARMGDVVRRHHESSGAASEGVPVGDFAASERRIHGPDIWARRTMESMEGDLFLVDGCRSMDEVRAFRGLSDVEIIAVHAPRSERFRRLVSRAREDAPKDEEEFDARDMREIGWGVAEVIALSEHMIVNDADIESFRLKSKELLERLR